MTTEARRHQQVRYSQPMKDGRLALPIRWDHREGIHADRLVSVCPSARVCAAVFMGRSLRIAVLPSVRPSLLCPVHITPPDTTIRSCLCRVWRGGVTCVVLKAPLNPNQPTNQPGLKLFSCLTNRFHHKLLFPDFFSRCGCFMLIGFYFFPH